MAEPDDPLAEDATEPLIRAFCEITLDHMPAIERRFLSQLADEVYIDLPSAGTDETAIRYVKLLFIAILTADEPPTEMLQPTNVDAWASDIDSYRRGFVQGAHSYGNQGAEGIARLLRWSIPAARKVLADTVGNADLRLIRLYEWLMICVITGAESETPATWAETGISASLSSWIRPPAGI